MDCDAVNIHSVCELLPSISDAAIPVGGCKVGQESGESGGPVWTWIRVDLSLVSAPTVSTDHTRAVAAAYLTLVELSASTGSSDPNPTLCFLYVLVDQHEKFYIFLFLYK